MSGKQAKREKRLAKEAARAEARRKERQKTIFTGIVVAIIIAIGGALIYTSARPPAPDVAATPSPSPDASPAETPSDDASPDASASPSPDARPVACGAEAPPNAGETKSTYEQPEQVLEEGTDYRAVVETSCGRVVIDLDEDRAPETTNNFVFLAQQGFFDGLEIFRNATSIGALQTGSGTDEASWDIGYTIGDELDVAEEEGYDPGSVAMANAGPNTGGSQFFFVYNDEFQNAVESGGLQPAYARFGMVTEGLDVLQRIGAIPVEGETPTELVYMNSVTIETAESGEGTGDPAEGGGEAAGDQTEEAPDEASPTATES